MSYKAIMNKKNKMNGLELLKLIDKESIKVVFFDPQYRGVLDKLSYGNEGKSRGRERSELPQMTKEIILAFINQIEQILKPSGYLFLWVDKFHLFECKDWIDNFKSIEIVDMITWDKQKIGMGYRSRRRCEYLIVIQKSPRKAKTTWNIHNIPDVWDEKINNKIHTHSKPVELQKQLILATTQEEDIVVDPASGGYSVLKACEETNRKFLGCDLKFGDLYE
ncbi:site-specific DNA-methyltransferase [Campylobacter sp. P255]|uniref:site-specific DNA-methyltransferase n=1 Tax=Campylobacter sp. P255 TaxID=1979368 RepID=UPI000EA940BD|nr:site-specific DNA-methyltransferase [Campylobacter sp. P255]RKO64672.1 site-specific DNA-methyltransferase [Campylobacter sp. P255]